MYHLKHQNIQAIRSFVVLATQNIHHVIIIMIIIIKHACTTTTSNIQALLVVVLGQEGLDRKSVV